MALKKIVHCFLLLIFTRVTTTATPGGEPLKFIASTWRMSNAPPSAPAVRFVHLQDLMTISCQTNDPDANVTLQYRKTRSSAGENVLTRSNAGGRITQNRQDFVVSPIRMTDGGFYQCYAKNKAENVNIELGNLVINPAVRNSPPEIYPDQAEVLVKNHGTITIKCQTQGKTWLSNTLKWYKIVDGNKVAVDASKTYFKREIKGDDAIDLIKLIFEKFTSADEGEYMCERTIQGAVIDKKIRLKRKPDFGPGITLTFSNLKPVENESITLSCNVTGSPRPERHWEIKNRRAKTCTDLYSPCELVISRIQYEKHNGKFTCVASNYVSKVTKFVIVEVQVPPRIKKSYAPSIIARSNEIVELFCDIERGNPPPFVTWFQHECKAGATICDTKSAPWKQALGQKPNNSTATTSSIINTQKTDHDYVYKCVAQNPLGTTSVKFKLVRNENHVHQFAVIPSDVHAVNRRDVLTVKCTVDQRNYDKSSVSLKRDGVNIPISPATQDNNTVLEFKTTKAELSDAGTYTCEAKSIREKVVRTRSVKVEVKEPPIIKKNYAASIFARSNEAVELFCDIEQGKPTPFVTWFQHECKAGATICDTKSAMWKRSLGQKPSNTTATTSSFLITQKTDLDYVYKCVAENPIGKTSVQFKLVRNENHIHQFAVVPSELHVVNREHVLAVKCTADQRNYEKSSVSLKKDGVNIPILKRAQENNIVLEFKTTKAEFSDAGNYTCEAKSIREKVVRKRSVKVEVKPGVVVVEEKSKSVILGVVIAAIILLTIYGTILFCCKRRVKHKYALHYES